MLLCQVLGTGYGAQKRSCHDMLFQVVLHRTPRDLARNSAFDPYTYELRAYCGYDDAMAHTLPGMSLVKRVAWLRGHALHPNAKS